MKNRKNQNEFRQTIGAMYDAVTDMKWLFLGLLADNHNVSHEVTFVESDYDFDESDDYYDHDPHHSDPDHDDPDCDNYYDHHDHNTDFDDDYSFDDHQHSIY